MFTVFLQGGTIKLFVNCLHIDKKSEEHVNLTEEINRKLFEHVMAGIEIVCGKHGEYYAQSWFKQIDKKYLKKIFCVREYDHTVRLRPQTQKNNNKNNIVILDIASCITFYILSYFF